MCACAPRKWVEQAREGGGGVCGYAKLRDIMNRNSRVMYTCAPRKTVEQAGRGAEISRGGRGYANFVTRDWL